MTVYLDFFLQVFVHAFAWCLAAIAALLVTAVAGAALSVLVSMFQADPDDGELDTRR